MRSDYHGVALLSGNDAVRASSSASKALSDAPGLSATSSN
eukprot:CAMPEP_0195585392 /NCGR_PEP_ID=MMETSP0814-20130614/27483_1 /TAXON_ID=97485 /ORGANISM="Prymnesium parvum, Strain Texoma1" /LENGTH=39 /DNA_ID= /DNA_START= /DNA_END= /DNA_ORIENTATION=